MEIDRRRGRRVALQVPLFIRRANDAQAVSAQESTKNVSLAGVYFETAERETYAVGDVLVASVCAGEAQTRGFPFTRLAGRGRVVRVADAPPQEPAGLQRTGVALEFGNDVTALMAIPRG